MKPNGVEQPLRSNDACSFLQHSKLSLHSSFIVHNSVQLLLSYEEINVTSKQHRRNWKDRRVRVVILADVLNKAFTTVLRFLLTVA